MLAHKRNGFEFSTAEKRIGTPPKTARLPRSPLTGFHRADPPRLPGRTRRSPRRNAREACRVSPRCQFGAIDGCRHCPVRLVSLRPARTLGPRAVTKQPEGVGRSEWQEATSRTPLYLSLSSSSPSLASAITVVEPDPRPSKRTGGGGRPTKTMPLRSLSLPSSPRAVASPRRDASVEISLSPTKKWAARAWIKRPRAWLTASVARAMRMERHPCELADGNDARGICSPVHGQRAMKRMKPITTLAQRIARGALVGPAAGKVARTSISASISLWISVDNGGATPTNQVCQVAGRGARAAERGGAATRWRWSLAGRDRAKIEDNKVARSAGGWGGEAVASWGMARGCDVDWSLLQRGGGGGFLDEKLKAMGLGAQRWSAALAWAERKEWRSGGSTTADNSLALSVNGKCCGECQCVTMNHGSKNQAVARSGGGL